MSREDDRDARIRALVDELLRERRALAERSSEFSLEIRSDVDGQVIARAEPYPGATEAELAAAEETLGRSYPADLRALLKVANGWPEANVIFDILGTQGVGMPGIPGYPANYPVSAWGLARESLEIMFDEVENEFTANLEIDDCLPVAASPITADFHFTIAQDCGAWRAGTIFYVDSADLVAVGGVEDLLKSLIETMRGLELA